MRPARPRQGERSAEVEGRGQLKQNRSLRYESPKNGNDLAQLMLLSVIEGIYQGSYTTVSGEKFETKLRLFKSSSYVPSDRIRTPEKLLPT